MTEEEIQEKREALAESLIELRKNAGWQFLVDQIIERRCELIDDCIAASRSEGPETERRVMRAAMRLEATDAFLDLIRDNIELGITEEEQQALGL